MTECPFFTMHVIGEHWHRENHATREDAKAYAHSVADLTGAYVRVCQKRSDGDVQLTTVTNL